MLPEVLTMKYFIILLSLFAVPAHAQQTGFPHTGSNNMYSATPEHRAKMRYYHEQSSVPRTTHSMPNIFGGEDFYGNRGYMGRSMPNVHGGRDFYRNY